MKRGIVYGLSLLGLFVASAVVCAVIYTLATGLRPSHPVGFQLVSVPDPKGPPLTVGVWYPAEAASKPRQLGLIVQFVAADAPIVGNHLPLVVISHGNGGGTGSHADTALALAGAGFVAAAPQHTGDNYADQSAVGRPKWVLDRARHISLTIDYMLKTWKGHDHIDARRIGIFGFSAGGFTALTAIGGEPDLELAGRHCAKTPEFACQLWKPGNTPLPPPTAFAHDGRIKAAVIAAPGFGFAFVPKGLAKVAVPVQLWNGADDVIVPTATNAEPVREVLGGRAEYHLVPGAAHFTFLVPCGLFGPRMLCRDADSFDREAFHKMFNAEVVKFFKEKL